MHTMSQTTYQIRIDENEKNETFKVLRELGITPAQAVKMFFAQVRITHSIPFPIDYTPNEKTAKMLLASDEEKGYKKHASIEDLFRDLDD